MLIQILWIHDPERFFGKGLEKYICGQWHLEKCGHNSVRYMKYLSKTRQTKMDGQSFGDEGDEKLLLVKFNVNTVSREP